jgi:hypothetical protein
MPDELTIQFDDDLDAWVIEGDPPGPAGVASWEAAGVYWAVDWVEPERLVRCEVAAETIAGGGPVAERALDLVELLLGEPVRQVLAAGRPDGDGSVAVPRGGGEAARRCAGWLAVTLDELEADTGGPALVLADAFLLARRVGIDDLLAFDIAAVHEVVDSLDVDFLDALALEDPATFDLLRAYGAVLAAAGIDLGSPLAPATADAVATDPADIAARFEAIVGTGALTFLRTPMVVWCQGLPVGAVLGASATLSSGQRRATVRARVGDLPPGQMHIQALREEGGAPAVVATARLQGGNGDDPGELVAEVDWLVTGATHLRLVTDPDEAPARLRPSREAMHWGREAARLARRFRIDPDDPAHPIVTDEAVGALWERSAYFWGQAGQAAQARQARDHAEATVTPSPYLRDRPSVRAVLERLVDGDPGRPSLADTAQVLGFTDLAAQARVATATALLEQGRPVGALAAAGRASRDYARLGDPEGTARADALVAEAEGPRP